MTKLQNILNDNNMTQAQLIEMIRLRTGRVIGKDRISKICSGRITNYSLFTANTISRALGIPIDTFIEHDNLTE
jgi:hypothetical protein